MSRLSRAAALAVALTSLSGAGHAQILATEITKTTHAVNLGNELTQVTVDSGSPVTADYVYDRNGNLIYDGSFWLQYDAFNRLCQVHPAGGLDPNSFNANGSLKDPNAAPDWVARYVHDAFGRLMRKRAPHPGDPDKKVTDEYYYDGVRRIQTKTTWQAVGGWPSGSAWQEYVYGPDYVDEFVAFVDDPLGSGVGTYYTLQDANYNLMATLRASGADGGPGGGTLTASNVVVRQYQWSPYGAPVVAEALTDNLPSAVTEAQAQAAGRIGHQGLFFERYDAGPDEPGIAANAAGIYYNRARFYTPYLGRFLQKDMNAAGLPVVAALAFNAAAMDAFLDAFDAQSHYGDGLNLYAYLGSNPIGRWDPLGLDWWDDDIDDAIVGMWADNAAFAERLYDYGERALRTATMIALQSALSAIVPGAGLALSVMGVGMSLEDIMENGLNWGNGLSLAANAVGGLGAASRALGMARGKFGIARARYNVGAKGNVSLPAFSRLQVRWSHILDRHHLRPEAYPQPGTTYFPSAWSEGTIRAAVRDAYTNGSKAGKGYGDAIKIHGYGGGLPIEVHVDVANNLIVTAFPLY